MAYTDYTAVARASYEDKIKTLSARFPLYDRVKKSKKGIKSLQGDFYVDWGVDPIIYTGSRIISHGGYLPAAPTGAMIKAQASLANVFAPLQVDGVTISNGAIIGDGEALDNELKRGWEDIAIQMEEIFWLPPSGILCTITASASGTSVTVNSTRFLYEGMKVDTYTDLSTTPDKDEDSKTISAINRATKTVTFSASVTVAAGDGIVREDCYNLYPGGIGAIANDDALIGSSDYYTWFATLPTTTYANISRSSYSSWKAIVMRHATAGTRRTLTAGLIGEALSMAQANNRSSEGDYVILCDGGMAYTIAALDSRTVIKDDFATKEVGFLRTYYYDNVNMRKLEIIPMKTAFPNTIIIAPLSELEVRWTGAPAYDESDGKIWTSQTKNNISGTYSGRDIALTNINTRMTPICRNPGKWIVLTDISYHSDMSNYPL